MSSAGRRRPVVAVLGGTLAGLAVTVAVITYGASGTLAVRDAAVGATTSEAAAVYFSIDNGTASTDELVGAECECAEQATLHVSRIDDRGVASMDGVEGLALAPGATTELEPGGSHVMRERLTTPLEPGDTVQLRLDFASGERRTVDVAVMDLAELADRSVADDDDEKEKEAP